MKMNFLTDTDKLVFSIQICGSKVSHVLEYSGMLIEMQVPKNLTRVSGSVLIHFLIHSDPSG